MSVKNQDDTIVFNIFFSNVNYKLAFLPLICCHMQLCICFTLQKNIRRCFCTPYFNYYLIPKAFKNIDYCTLIM